MLFLVSRFLGFDFLLWFTFACVIFVIRFVWGCCVCFVCTFGVFVLLVVMGCHGLGYLLVLGVFVLFWF